MHTTLSSKRRLPAILLVMLLLAGCGVTTKKTFLDEPVQDNAGKSPPLSSDAPGQTAKDALSRNPALDSAEATGVQKLLNIITPYRIDIQQGNFVSQEMLTRIQPGMTKEQVRFALGTPLLTDIFHSNRWDYLFRLQKPSGKITNNRVVIYFESNRVARIANDLLPEEKQYLETIAGPVSKKQTDDASKKTAADNATADTPRKEASAQAETPVSGKPASAADSYETPTEAAVPVTVEPPAATPASPEIPESAPAPAEAHRSAPANIPESAPSRAETIKSTSSSTETIHTAPASEGVYRLKPAATAASKAPATRETGPSAPPVTDTHEKEPVSTGSADTVVPEVSVTTGPVRTYTPDPAKQAEPEKAVTTITQDVSSKQEDDFKAAPHSTMQLHQLMQPQ